MIVNARFGDFTSQGTAVTVNINRSFYKPDKASPGMNVAGLANVVFKFFL